jgi:hypothetical protein
MKPVNLSRVHTARFFILVICCTAIIFAQDKSTLGIQWQEVSGNPTLVGGPCLSWMCAGVSDPTIVQNLNGTVSAWFTTVGIQKIGPNSYVADGPYTGWASEAIGNSGVTLSTGTGATIPVGSPGLWDRYIETPTVRYNPGSSLPTMWYVGYSALGFASSAIGQMTANDPNGTTWTRPAAPIYRPSPSAWDGILVTGPTVVHGPDGLWRLYYTGIGTKLGIGLLTSLDGMNWTPYANNPVLEPEPNAWDDQILEQCVIYTNGQYWMWYSGYRGQLNNSTSIAIGLATSPDGEHWTRYSGNPVLLPGAPGSWDDLRVVAPDVLVEPDGSLLMAAYGQAQTDIGRSAGSIGFWRSH